MEKNGIKTELFFSRGRIIAEATQAYMLLALTGHLHHTIVNYGSMIELGVFDNSEEEQQTTIAVLRNMLQGNWRMIARNDECESGHFWYTEFKYVF